MGSIVSQCDAAVAKRWPGRGRRTRSWTWPARSRSPDRRGAWRHEPALAALHCQILATRTPTAGPWLGQGPPWRRHDVGNCCHPVSQADPTHQRKLTYKCQDGDSPRNRAAQPKRLRKKQDNAHRHCPDDHEAGQFSHAPGVPGRERLIPGRSAGGLAACEEPEHDTEAGDHEHCSWRSVHRFIVADLVASSSDRPRSSAPPTCRLVRPASTARRPTAPSARSPLRSSRSACRPTGRPGSPRGHDLDRSSVEQVGGGPGPS